MKKIPTLFERDWDGDRSRVTPQVNAGCEWVLAGEGIATRKLDGTSCLIRGGKLYKRREVRNGDPEPLGFDRADYDEETKKTVGWVPVIGGPESRYHTEAFTAEPDLPDGTYELVGPKVQGNPERWPDHRLVLHGTIRMDDAPRTFEELKSWFEGKDIEGLVFAHPDGRMAKIKLRDFGIKRAKVAS